MAPEKTKHVNELFRMGGRPFTNFFSINSKGEIKELLWLEDDFSHGYGINRLWGTNEWLEDPILLHICKQSGGDVVIFEGIFYLPLDPYHSWDKLVTVKEALTLFMDMKVWVRSKSYNNLANHLESKPNIVYTNSVLKYFKENEFEKDLDKLIEKLGNVPQKDKVFIEISF